jgi:hypothetical protein
MATPSSSYVSVYPSLLDLPEPWPIGAMGLTSETFTNAKRIRALGISANGQWLAGTYLNQQMISRRWTAYRPITSPLTPVNEGWVAENLGDEKNASARGINDDGVIVGFNEDADGIKTHHAAIQLTGEFAGTQLGLGPEVYSEAFGITDSMQIVGGYKKTRKNKMIGFIGFQDPITHQILGPQYIGASDLPSSSAKEDFWIQAINSQGDLVVSAQTSGDMTTKRSIVGIKRSSGGWAWYPIAGALLISKDPAKPDAIVILGMNKDRVIVGKMQTRTDDGRTPAFYGVVDDQGRISGLKMFHHPSADTETELAGISDGGLICGTCDLKQPFVYQLSHAGISWLIERKLPNSDWSPLDSPIGPHSNADRALRMHALLARIGDKSLRKKVEKPLLDYLKQQIALLSKEGNSSRSKR